METRTARRHLRHACRVLRACLRLGVLGAPILCSGCGHGTTGSGTTEGVPASAPRPDLEGLEPRVRELLAGAADRVDADPRSAAAWGALGNACFPHDFFAEAIVAYDAAHRLEPTRFEWAYMLGVALDYSGIDPARVAETLQAAITLRPDDPYARTQQGDALIRLGRLEEALEAYATARRLLPGDAHTLRRIAEVSLQLGRVEDAKAAAEQGIALAPSAREFRTLLGQALLRLGRTEQGNAELDLAETLPMDSIPRRDPVVDRVMAGGRSSSLLYRYGVALVNQRRFADAVPLFRICEEVHPDSARVHTYLGICALALNQPAEARRRLGRAIGIHPQEHEALLGLARLEASEGRADDALALADRAIAVRPEDPRAWAVRGLALGMLRRPAEAVISFERAAERGDVEAPDHLNWARALLELEQVPDAGRRLEQAIRRDPGYIPARLLMAELMRALRRPDQARIHLLQVLRLDPSNATARERLAALDG